MDQLMSYKTSAFSQCQECKTGQLVPLSDDGPNGEDIYYKGWVCTNPSRGFAVKIGQGRIHRINILTSQW